MKNISRYAVILGSLLHDIGKFVQRAQKEPKKYHHTKWGIDWFQREKGLRERPKLAEVFSEQDIAFIDSSINTHHDHVDYVTLADYLSSGEREPIKLEMEEPETREIIPFCVRMKSIFPRLFGLSNYEDIYHRLTWLGEDKLNETFPIAEKECTTQEYAELLDKFNKEIEKLNFIKLTHQQIIEQIYYLLWKYTWCIPSAAYENEPDISLFDHLKTTAAIASCLYESEVKEISQNDKFMLVCGDICGIQKFVYKISSKGAAKGLKGRSFYLQLISDAIARYILRQSGYCITNLIYSGGGRFYLLLDSGCENIVREVVDRINHALLDKFNGEIYLAVGLTKFSQENFKGETFCDKWHDVSMEVNAIKRKKFYEFNYKELFEPFGEGGLIKTCTICRKEEKQLTNLRIGDEEIDCCSACKELLELGTLLPKHNYILEVYKEKQKNHNGFYFDFIETSFYFVTEKEDLRKYTGGEVVLYSINLPQTFLNFEGVTNSDIVYGFKFIGGNFAPEKDNEILTFDDLAENSEGIKRLGILRMDVDNLSEVFMKGLGKYASISRVTTLSRNLDIFFNGYINTIIKKEEYDNKAYIIYSGGDDLFIVGCWNIIPLLAKDIYKEFRKFTCNKLSLSCGIYLIPKKYPIYKGAELAKDEEDKAKEYRRNGKEKDAISFLGSVVSWDDFSIAEEISKSLYNWIKNGKQDETTNEVKKLSKGIIDRLKRIFLLYTENKKFWQSQKKQYPIDEIKEKIKYDQWLWRMVYYLDRYSKQNKLFQEEINKIRDAILNDTFNGRNSQEKIIEYLNLPTRWAELLLEER